MMRVKNICDIFNSNVEVNYQTIYMNSLVTCMFELANEDTLVESQGFDSRDITDRQVISPVNR